MFTLPDTARWQLASRLIRSAIGLLLLVTAGMKLYDLLYGQAAALLWLPSPRWILGAVEIETLIGLWLLSGWQASWAWIVSLILFAGLAAVSFYLGMTGQTSCGCFGRVEIHPWWTFSLDIAILLVLALIKPVRSTATITVWLKNAFQIAGGTVAIVGLITLGVTLLIDDPEELLAKLRDETLVIEPAIMQLGDGHTGEVRSFTVTFKNHSSKPIRIVGGTTSCSCLASKDLPLTVPAYGSQEVNVLAKFTGSPGRFLHRFIFYNDSEWQVSIARFSGRVIENPEKQAASTP